MTVAFVVLIITLATNFLSTISARKDESIGAKLQLLTQLAADSGIDHAKRVILEDYASDNFTTIRSRYRTEFLPVDASNNPVDYYDAYTGSNKKTVDDPLINAYNNIEDKPSLLALMPYQGSYQDSQLVQIGSSYGFNYRIPGNGEPASARWHNLRHLDTKGNETSPARAEFVLRYAVEISDESGKHAINPDYPGHPLTYDYNADDLSNTEYLKYKVYIQRYAKAVRSIYAAPPAHYLTTDALMTHNAWINHAGDYSVAYDGIDAAGDGAAFSHPTNGFGASEDQRPKIDHLFRGDGLIVTSNGYLSQGISGSVYSYDQIYAALVSGGVEGETMSELRFLSPFTRGTRDQDWVTASDRGIVTATNTPNCPWRINVTTCTRSALQALIFGMSSHTQCRRQVKATSSFGLTACLDLFGPEYPEAFPLGINDGRDVHIVGGDTKFINDTTSEPINGTRLLTRTPKAVQQNRFTWSKGMKDLRDAYLNSYWQDISTGLYTASLSARATWNLIDNPNASNGTINNVDSNSLLTLISDYTANPSTMQQSLEAEFLRLLGEDLDPVSNPGLLASAETGAIAWVGFGEHDGSSLETQSYYYDGGTAMEENASIKKIGDGSPTATEKQFQNDNVTKARESRLSPNANTRAMEYTLNDVCMSVFGSDARDFNNDGTAESTTAGWMNNGIRYWSYYFEGVHDVRNPNALWLTEPCWYRIWVDGSNVEHVARFDGYQWQEDWDTNIANEAEEFKNINRCFMFPFSGGAYPAGASGPIKPWSATGRLYVGKSNVFNITAHAEIFNTVTMRKHIIANAEIVFHVDPNHDGDLADSQTVFKRLHNANKASNTDMK